MWERTGANLVCRAWGLSVSHCEQLFNRGKAVEGLWDYREGESYCDGHWTDWMNEQAQLEPGSAVCKRSWGDSWMKNHYVKNATFGKREQCEQMLMLNKKPNQPNKKKVKSESRHSWEAADGSSKRRTEPLCYVNSKLCCCNWYNQCARWQWQGVFLSRQLLEIETEWLISVASHLVFSNDTFLAEDLCLTQIPDFNSDHPEALSYQYRCRVVLVVLQLRCCSSNDSLTRQKRWKQLTGTACQWHNSFQALNMVLGSRKKAVLCGRKVQEEQGPRSHERPQPRVWWSFCQKLGRRDFMSASACPDIEWRCEKYFVQWCAVWEVFL